MLCTLQTNIGPVDRLAIEMHDVNSVSMYIHASRGASVV